MFEKLLFIISTILTVGGAGLVVFQKNLMHACIYLLASLIGIAGLYVTLSADFVAATQMVVYVGGVIILMVFAIMLTGGADANRTNRFGLEKIPAMGSMKTYIFGGLSAACMLLVLWKLLLNVTQTIPFEAKEHYTSTVEQIGTMLITDHVLAFEISSVLLLGALIGSAIIARPRKLTKVEDIKQ